MPRRVVKTTSWSLVVGVGLIGLIVGYLVGAARSDRRIEPPAESSRQLAASGTAPRQPARAVPTPARGKAEPPTPERPVAAAPSPPVELPPVPSGDGNRVALVIDDLGRRVQDVVDLSALGVRLSFGVLPFESRTSEVLEELERRGGEILLHLPMQPLTEDDPGPGALTRGMSAGELEAATRWALEAVGSAAGVNNHMGSELSADADSMRTILSVLAERELYFLDSKTSPDSVGYRMALELGMPAAERQVFLDSEADPEAIRLQFRRLLAIASKRGSAVAIGHPYAETLAILREEVPLALAAGFEFVPVSSVTRRAVSTSAAPAHSERKTSTGLD